MSPFDGTALTKEAANELGQDTPLSELMREATQLRDQAWGDQVSYSRKVFIPLTELCRDVCHYCTYAKTPRRLDHAYLSPEQVLDIALRGQAQGCKEALFTLGDKPELRYRAARDALHEHGHETTLSYLHEMAGLVLSETGLLPHLNPGVMSLADYTMLRDRSPSMGIMLESSSRRLFQHGGPHFGSPDKDPAIRLAAIRDAGLAKVPLTSGILIGIGETRAERIDSLYALRDLHAQSGHLQEIIIQNFVPKHDTIMSDTPAPAFEELLWTIAMARQIFGPTMSIQAPPNLNPGRLQQLVDAGINDWGGVSPVTPDHVNPESPWPALDALDRETDQAGKSLVERLTIYPAYIAEREQWLHRDLYRPVLELADSDGFARCENWAAGTVAEAPTVLPSQTRTLRPNRLDSRLSASLAKARRGDELDDDEILRLFGARGPAFEAVCQAADELRQEVSGDTVAYVVNRNINYTNVCTYKCKFCAFSKGKTSENLRGSPYLVDMAEISRRSEEAWNRGGTEVCLQGGIHPSFTGDTYLEICEAVKSAAPDIHVHAFSPLEVTHGASTLGLSIEKFLTRLKAAGLGTLPGTAAEILDDAVRQIICPDKITAGEWLDVIRTAHRVGLRTTSTIMFGHLETPASWVRHLQSLRALQQDTSGITEFVPLPFVHMEAPMYIRGMARPGPTYREVILMHAVARLVLHPLITNIQVSWVKLGEAGAAACLNAGANDLGGTLMNESISRAAGAEHGQELSPESMDALIRNIGRNPRHRDTLYADVPAESIARSYGAPPLVPVHNRHAREYQIAS
jgi:FO synthase